MIRNYYKRTQCGFLRCHPNYDANDTMLRDIEKSGLTYIVLNMEDSCCYCVVNNRFAPYDFRKLMIDWCKRFNLGTVFITWPYPERRKSDGQPLINKTVVVKGYDYNDAGIAAEEYDTTAVEKYIDTYDESGLELHETHWPSNYSVNGRVMGIINFKKLYPHLSAY